MEKSSALPYRVLGGKLKAIRQRLNESLDELSGAVEVDVEELKRYELGAVRPSEDVLTLLISHFDIDDDHAIGLWELAGYDNEQAEAVDKALEDLSVKTFMVMMSMDNRILYTDNAQIVANKNGLVVNFLQQGTNNQQVPVARIGMSFEQTQELVKGLMATLNQAAALRVPKALPAPKVNRKPLS